VVTSRAVSEGIKFTVALSVYPASHRDERAIKKIGVKNVCPACGGSPEVILAKAGIIGALTRFPVVEMGKVNSNDGSLQLNPSHRLA
jgi:hypothetical protein